MDITPNTNNISLDILEKYIERYPEDTEKWLDFIRDPAEDVLLRPENYLVGQRRVRQVGGELNEELYKKYSDLQNVVSEVPIENYRDGCLFCKKSWASTQGVPTMTHICGHTYHTLCAYVDQINNDVPTCIVEGCDINSWDYAKDLIESKNVIKTDTENILFESYKKRADFKQDIKDLKTHVSSVVSAYTKVNSLMSLARKELIHKHIHTINHIQDDLNLTVKTVKQS